jgi:multiple sugar transport system substrate-binding protein
MTDQGRVLKDGFGRSISRRDFLKISGAGLAGAALLGVAGCGGGGGGQEDGETTLIFSNGPEPSGTLRTLIDDFNEQHSGEIRVEWREMPADSGTYFDQIRTEFQAGGGDIDVIVGDVIWPAQLAANGWIVDLSDRFPEEERQAFLDGPIEANTYEGGIYGVPWFTDAGMLYYRRDLLEEAGLDPEQPPQTWSELKDMAQQVQEQTGTQFGFLFQGSNYEGGTVNALEYIWTHGGDVLNARGDEVTIASPESVAGLATARSMIEDGVSPQAVANYAETETHSTFLRGEAIFARNWPYMYGLAGTEDFPDVTPEQIGVAPLPAGEGGESFSGLGGWNFLVNAASDKQDAAWTFIEYMSAPEQQKRFALGGSFLPTRTELYDNQEILDAIPVIALAREALENAKPRPVSPYYSDMSLRIAEQWSAVINGNTDPQQAVQTLQNQLQEIVEAGQSA